jgi:molybdopterin synthase sulfur carrier subunit
VNVRIPTPLRSYTGGHAYVQASGATIGELLIDLDRRYPGLRFRMVDEQGRLRPHLKVFVGDESERDLSRPITAADEVTIMQALSGG